MSANDSFEYTWPFWGWVKRGPGSDTRYCNDWTGAANGVCFVERGHDDPVLVEP